MKGKIGLKKRISYVSIAFLMVAVVYTMLCNQPVNATTSQYEVEVLTTTVSDGRTHSAQSDTNASGGFFDKGDLNAEGQSIMYDLNVTQTGTYMVSIRYKRDHTMGMWKLNIDGMEQSTYYDGYSDTMDFETADIGVVTFENEGMKQFEFVITGKNENSTDYNTAIDAIMLTPIGTVYETSDLPTEVTDGRTHTAVSGSYASEGSFDKASLKGVGEYVRYTVNVPEPGTYNVKVRYKKNTFFGVWKLRINGVQQGATYDSYSSSTYFETADLGTVTFDKGGNKFFKFQVTGKNSKSKNYNLAIDYIALTPRGATVPWVTYEGEGMVLGGNATIIDNGNSNGTHYSKALEASNRSFVKLASTGDYVEFVAKEDANAITVRTCIPDAPAGGGIDDTLSLYIDGVHHRDLDVTSHFTWNYRPYPFKDDPASGGDAVHFWDDTEALLSTTIPAGTVIRLQKDDADTAAYYMIDLVDLEQTSSMNKPVDYIAITDAPYNAIADDGNDDTEAIYAAITDAKAQGKGVWLPSGTFDLKATAQIASSNTGYMGDGYVKLMDKGATCFINVEADLTGNKTATLRYANGTGGTQSISVFVGSTHQVIPLPPTNDWNTWVDYDIAVDLPGGYENIIRFANYYGDTGQVNIDQLTVNQVTYQCEETKYLMCPIYVDNVTIKGAGVWYSKLKVDKPNQTGNNHSVFFGMGDNVTLSDFAIWGDATQRDFTQDGVRGLKGSLGTGSVVNNIYFNHLRASIIIGEYKWGLPANNGLKIINCRVKNSYADSINLYGKSTNCLVENNYVRGSGDDSFVFSCDNGVHNIVRNNTSQSTWFGQGISMYSGEGHIIENNLVYDAINYGIDLSTNFYHDGNLPVFSGLQFVKNNSVIRANKGIVLFTYRNNVKGVRVRDCDVMDSLTYGINFVNRKSSQYAFMDTLVEGVYVDGTKDTGIMILNGVNGEATFDTVTVFNSTNKAFDNVSSSFTVIKQNGNEGW